MQCLYYACDGSPTRWVLRDRAARERRGSRCLNLTDRGASLEELVVRRDEDHALLRGEPDVDSVGRAQAGRCSKARGGIRAPRTQGDEASRTCEQACDVRRNLWLRPRRTPRECRCHLNRKYRWHDERVPTGEDRVDTRARSSVIGFIRAHCSYSDRRIEDNLHRRLSTRSRTASPAGSPNCASSSRNALASAAAIGFGFRGFGVATLTGTIAAAGLP